MARQYFAHTLPDRGQDDWQSLEDHLRGVGDRSKAVASRFQAADLGWLAGVWHDLGKYSEAFQSYISQSPGDPHQADIAQRVDHSTAGAQHAITELPVIGHLLAYCIAGHHSGLLDAVSAGACLDARLKKSIPPWQAGAVPIPVPGDLALPSFLRSAFARPRNQDCAFTVAFFVRMLFSALVDADFLDTEEFMDPQRAVERPRWPADVIDQLAESLSQHMDGLERDAIETPVNNARSEVLAACRQAAANVPGLFSLTVPTGGGKTLSSLAFALEHARHHGKRRVVYVIPFTSIIEQNADVFRQVFREMAPALGVDPVLEHHSNVDVSAVSHESVRSRLAAENWDCPIIVTTSVQFFESLFAARTSRCRKLHALVDSVVVLDEAQALPVGLLAPCLRALRELVDVYGVSAVLCTATQPSVARRPEFPIGLDGIREIVHDPVELHRRLERVKVVEIPADGTPPFRDEDLSARLMREEQVLCVVNTRRHARELFTRIGREEGHFHLSASMCPEHRSRTLQRIREALQDGNRCRVVSTQLVEAGVDIDFPVVYRSLAGLDAIAQAAGRCNRNGLLPTQGRLHVFRSEHKTAERFLAGTVDAAAQSLTLHPSAPLSLPAIEQYFRSYYWSQSARWDEHGIAGCFRMSHDPDLPFLFDFSTVAARFRLIDDRAKPVIIGYGRRGKALCDELRRSPAQPRARLLRQLQRFTVQVAERTWREHVGGSIELVHERFPVLVAPELHYRDDVGLHLENPALDLMEC